MNAIKASEIPKVVTFLSNMEAQSRQFEIEQGAEEQLASAVEHYEQVFKRKLVLNFKSSNE